MKIKAILISTNAENKAVCFLSFRFIDTPSFHSLSSGFFLSQTLFMYSVFYRFYTPALFSYGICHGRNRQRLRQLVILQLYNANSQIAKDDVHNNRHIYQRQIRNKLNCPHAYNTLGIYRNRTPREEQYAHCTGELERSNHISSADAASFINACKHLGGKHAGDRKSVV